MLTYKYKLKPLLVKVLLPNKTTLTENSVLLLAAMRSRKLSGAVVKSRQATLLNGLYTWK